MGGQPSSHEQPIAETDSKIPDLEKGPAVEEEKKHVDPRTKPFGKLDDEQKAMMTPNRLLLYGALEGNKDLVKEAREAGGDVNTPDTGPVLKQGEKPSNDAYANLVTGNYPLHMAAQNGHTEMITLLFHFEANLENKNKIGSTALHTAVSHNHIDAVRELLKLGAKAGALNGIGNTPVHCAAYTGNVEIMEILLQNGGARFIHAKNKVEMTPIDYARKKQMVDYLTQVSMQSGHPVSIPRGIPEADETKERKSIDETMTTSPQILSLDHISMKKSTSQGITPMLDGKDRATSISNCDVTFHHSASTPVSPLSQAQPSPTSP